MANFTTVATFSGPLEAHIARGRLEAEGIPVFIANEQHIWADMLLSPALGGIRIQVLEENAEKAREKS